MNGWWVRIVALVAPALLVAGCGVGTPGQTSPGRATNSPSTAGTVDTPDDLAPFVINDWTATGEAVGQLFGACVPSTVPACYRQANQAASHIGTLLTVLQNVNAGPHLKQPVADLARDLSTARTMLTGYQQYLLGKSATRASPSPAAGGPSGSANPTAFDQFSAVATAVSGDAQALKLDGWAGLTLPRLTPDPHAADAPRASPTPATGQATPPPSNCVPAPCETNRAAGVSLLVGSVNRNVAGNHVTPYPGTHFVEVSFTVVVAGSAPGSVLLSSTNLTVTDSTGTANAPVVVDAPGCDALNDQTVNPGTNFGPATACFQVQGDVAGPLSLNWKPGPQGLRLDLALP